ncbi:MAG: hypothetical protein II875_09565 [Clostridia bacterium]|nr:hypothetical protein [Clostridia bacterium]
MVDYTRYKVGDLPPVIGYKDIQRLFGFSRSMTYALLNRPDVGAFVLGGRRFISTEVFLEWIRKQGNGGAQGE